MFEIAYDPGAPEIIASSRDQGLVHVKRDRKSAVDTLEADLALVKIERTLSTHSLGYEILRTANVRQTVNVRRYSQFRILHPQSSTIPLPGLTRLWHNSIFDLRISIEEKSPVKSQIVNRKSKINY
jgi:hypothetical protein